MNAWTVHGPDGETTIEIPSGGVPIGLVADPTNGPAFVVRSSAGQITRIVDSSSVHTLTHVSADLTSVSVHPTQPLLVVERDNGTVEVVDLVTRNGFVVFRPVPR